MKKTILIVLAVFVLLVGLYRHFTAPNEVPPITNKVQIIDDNNQPVSHAKPLLPPGCATVECKGTIGHISKGDEYLRKHQNKRDELPKFGGSKP